MSDTELANRDELALVTAMEAQAEEEILEDPELVAKAIMERILEAGNLEDIFAQQDSISSRDILAVPIEVRDLRFNRSRIEGGPKVYAVLDVINLKTGERMVVSTSARNPMAQLYRCKQLDLLPVRVAFRSSDRPTESGYYPLWLELLKPEPADGSGD